MADDITLSLAVGVGAKVATDEIGLRHFPRNKLIFGGDGVNEGDVSTSNPLPVEVKEKVALTNVSLWGTGPGKISVGVTSTLVLAANASRTGALITNDSPNVIYLRIGSAAVLNEGFRLNPNGGSYEIDSVNLSTLIINAISAVAASNLTVDEAV